MKFYIFLLGFLILQVGIVLVKCDTKNVLLLPNDTIKDINLYHIVNSFNIDSVSSKCGVQMNLLKENIGALITMADAWSKIPYTGMQEATRTDYGNFDECVSIELKNDAGKMLGKHCLGLIIPDFLAPNQTAMLTDSYKLSYCIPDACTANDLNDATGIPLFMEITCNTKDTNGELDTGAIIVLCVFITFILLMVGSTIHDVYLFYNEKENTNPISTAFSAFNNGKKLLTIVNHSKEQVLCFHGLKFIGMWWIIAGHSWGALLATPVMNNKFITEFTQKLSSGYIMTGNLAVDTFFFISGFLLSYLYFKNDISKKSAITQVKAIPSMILHRYLRLTPAVVMLFIFFVYLNKYLGSGPLYSMMDKVLKTPCTKYWWSVFLYIQNYYVFSKINAAQGDQLCLAHLWYLSVDMQLFLLAPIIIIPISILYSKSFKHAIAALSGLILLFLVIPIFTKLQWRNYDPSFIEFDSHSRLIDYFIGVTMGLYLRHEKNKTLRIGTWTNILFWSLALGAMFGVLYFYQEQKIHYGYVGKTITLSFARPVWCIGLCWITYACFTGRGGIVNWLLSNYVMQVGGKLTYSMYLVHYLIVENYAFSLKDKRIVNHLYNFYDWCGHLILTLIVATFWSLAFEFPMMTLEKWIFGGAVKTPKVPANQERNTEERKNYD